MTDGKRWGRSMHSAGTILLLPSQVIAAFEASGHPAAFGEDDHKRIAEWIERYRLHARAEGGAAQPQIIDNLEMLVRRLDDALELVYEQPEPYAPDREIPGASMPTMQLAGILTNELDGEHLSFDWRAREAFQNRDVAFYDTIRRAIEATTYLRECVRLTGARLRQEPKRLDLKAREDLVLRIVALFEARTGKRASVTVDPYIEGPLARRSAGATFVRSILNTLRSYVRGELSEDYSSDPERYLRLVAGVSQRADLEEACIYLSEPPRLENLIDKFNRKGTPVHEDAERVRLRIGKQLSEKAP